MAKITVLNVQIAKLVNPAKTISIQVQKQESQSAYNVPPTVPPAPTVKLAAAVSTHTILTLLPRAALNVLQMLASALVPTASAPAKLIVVKKIALTANPLISAQPANNLSIYKIMSATINAQ